MKAVVLYSGGLDSSLALTIMSEWSAQVFPLHISHRFISLKSIPKIPNLKILDVSEEFVGVVQNPQHGYGKSLNPCIDCRILMLKKAKEYLDEVKADFLVTGEVLDQRPMSQRLEALMFVDKEADCEGLVVRPLSGGLLPATIPEKKGLIDRNNLLKIKGRSRKHEYELAKEKNITQVFSPSGGCLLTDPSFSRRLADLMRYQGEIDINDIELLKIGRHFRLSPEAKLIVGRHEQENKRLEKLLTPPDTLLYVPNTGSPNALLHGNKRYLKKAASITARYSDKKNETKIEVMYNSKKESKKIGVKPIKENELAKWRI